MNKETIWDGSLDPEKLVGRRLEFREKDKAKKVRRIFRCRLYGLFQRAEGRTVCFDH